MSDYADASAGVRGDQPQERAWWQCAAPGCCLSGSMSTSTQGTNDWWCRVHFGTPRGDRDSITAMIANRKALFDIAYELLRPQTLGKDTNGLRDQVRVIRPELLKQAHDAKTELGSFMLQVLGRECRSPQQHMGTPKPAGRGTTWLDTTSPEEIDA